MTIWVKTNLAEAWASTLVLYMSFAQILRHSNTEWIRRNHEDRTRNKYKFKIGAAIADFGSIKFDNRPFTRGLNISSDGDTTDWADFEEVTRFNGTNDIDSFAKKYF